MAEFAQFLIIGLVAGSVYALIAIGYTMVYGIIELINFAHGDLFMLGSFLALQMAIWLGSAPIPGSALPFDPPGLGLAVLSVVVMLVAAPIFCAAINVAVDRIVYKPIRNAPKIAIIVSAIGVSFLFMNAGLFWRGATDVNFPSLIGNANIAEGSGLRFTWKDLMVIGVTVPTMIALSAFVRLTTLGKAMRATAQ